MGALIGCCAGQALCCAGQMCCSCLCGLCQSNGVKKRNFSKIGYTVFQMIFIGIATALMFNAESLLKFRLYREPMTRCPPELTLSKAECLGVSIILRMSFTLFCFHLLMFVIVCSRNSVAAAFHDGCWLFKALLVIAGFGIQCGCDNDFYMIGCLEVAKWISAVFLIYQCMLMLIAAYKINDQLVENYKIDETCCSEAILAGVLISITGFNILWIYKSYESFTCSYNLNIQTATLIGVILMHVIVLAGAREDATILTSALASLYCLYLQWSALSSDSNAECNKNLNSNEISWLQITFGMVFTMLSLLIISGSSKAQEQAQITPESEDKDPKYDSNSDDDDNKYKKEQKKYPNQHKFPISQSTILFQGLLMLASLYYSMLCTDWGNLVLTNDKAQEHKGNDTAYWLKLFAEFLTMALYMFSLVAPLLFPDRDFS